MKMIPLILILILILIYTGCAAYSTPAIKKNAAFITDGTEQVRTEFKAAVAEDRGVSKERAAELAPMLDNLNAAAKVNEKAVGSPKVRLNVSDADAVKANMKQADADAEKGSRALAWTLGIGGTIAGLFGAGWIATKLNKAAAAAGGVDTT